MKNYMPLDGLRCSRDSGSAHCDTPKSAVLGRPEGGDDLSNCFIAALGCLKLRA